ncbi:HEAT repeat domain-containing protein [bacterium]|nr:HEAT repeat domain-containing protein [bacterium]
MDYNSNNFNSLETQEESKAPLAQQHKMKSVQEILQLLDKAFSQVKIFSPHHTNVKKFNDLLYSKLHFFLEQHWKLQLGIQEFSFTFEGKPAFTEKQITKSLPFIFYKDGARLLFFYKGLKKEELIGFLEIIKRESSKPAEESDIVISLWEKDFANIRYHAPDEFLETKIGEGMERLDYQVEKTILTTGKINLSPEDRQALQKSSLAQRALQGKSSSETESEEKKPDSPLQNTSLNKEEVQNIEKMVASHRDLSNEDELISLLTEMLNFEQRPQQFKATLQVLAQSHRTLLERGDFSRASLVLDYLRELQKSSQLSTENHHHIQEFVLESSNQEALHRLEKVFKEKERVNLEDFFQYVELLGAAAIPLISHLYKTTRDTVFKKKALNFITETGKQNLSALMDIVQEDKPELTKQVIKVLSSVQDKKAVQYLAYFTQYKNNSIKKEAIKALGHFKDKKANKILMAFLKERDEDLRTQAAQNLYFKEDPTSLQHVLSIVGEKNFHKKNWKEKKALLDFLAQSQNPTALTTLKKLLKKSGLLLKPKRAETSRAALSALKAVNTTETKKIIQEGAQIGSKKIKKECQSVLESRFQDK